LMRKPQLTCVLDVTGSLVQSLDCADTSTVGPARKGSIKNKFIALAKVHSKLDWLIVGFGPCSPDAPRPLLTAHFCPDTL
jgi:hypothetical protein